ncbi:hypothetical protein, partial [Pontiella sp.]|uniref:hypothetical protein n=1 Tax=Pontiella sp. TaxID=2837462 RepID=UPI003563C2CC
MKDSKVLDCGNSTNPRSDEKPFQPPENRHADCYITSLISSSTGRRPRIKPHIRLGTSPQPTATQLHRSVSGVNERPIHNLFHGPHRGIGAAFDFKELSIHNCSIAALAATTAAFD